MNLVGRDKKDLVKEFESLKVEGVVDDNSSEHQCSGRKTQEGHSGKI